MRKNKRLPRFPFDYIDEKADEYDNSVWMERNQKRTTLLSIHYLFDDKLQDNEENGIQMGESNLILDLGCGTGFSSEVLIENGFNVIGIDLLPDMLIKLREKKKNYLNLQKNLELIMADINFLPIKPNSIDHIISISSYNFVIYGKEDHGEKVKLLGDTAKKLNKILRNKGRIIIEFYPKDEQELHLHPL